MTTVRVRPPGTAAIGIDVGGSNVRAALVDYRGRILARLRAATPVDRNGDALLGWMTDSVHELLDTFDDKRRVAPANWPVPIGAGPPPIRAGVSACRVPRAVRRPEPDTGGSGHAGTLATAAAGGNFVGGCTPTPIGLALPGPLDAVHGTVIRSVNLPFLEARSIAFELAQGTELPVRVVTDADAATWAEYLACEPGPERFAHLRLGSGVALGEVRGGRLLRRPRRDGRHLEALVVTAAPDAPSCVCGRRGCLEAYVGWSVLECARGRPPVEEPLQPDRFCTDRGPAIDAVSRGAWALARCVEKLRRRLPRGAVFVLGGGTLGAFPALIRDIQVDRSPHPCGTHPGAGVHRARLGDDAGVIGAALLALASNDDWPPAGLPE